MSKTAVGGDDERPNKWQKFKNSPAAQEYRTMGAKSVAKAVGGMAKDVIKESASKASYALGLSDPGMRDRGNVAPRNPHFISSYQTARAENKNMTCATCKIEEELQ